jgi:hypothetical protein
MSETVPTHIESPLYWTPQELEYLEGSSSFSLAVQTQREIERLFANLTDVIFKVPPPLKQS